MGELVDITGVEIVAAYRLRLSFADQTVGDVDFSTREWSGVFAPLKDPGYFARVAFETARPRSKPEPARIAATRTEGWGWGWAPPREPIARRSPDPGAHDRRRLHVTPRL